VYEVAGGFDAGGGLGGNALCGSAHYGTSCFNDQGAARTLCIPASELDYANSFHTYAVAWTQTTIKWYVDGREFGEITAQTDPGAFGLGPPGPFGPSSAVRDPFSIVINTAIAWWVPPQSGTPNIPPGGAQHLIDWVRVWNGP
jgi:beta-glucanase (GH16 family)